MKYAILFFLSLTLCFSCSQSGEQKVEEPATAPVVEKAKEALTPSSTTAEEMGINTMIRGEYVSAAVTAEATEYGFKLDNGEQVIIRVSNEEGAKNPIMPEGMLDNGEDLGGMPSANLEMLGKFFTIEKTPSGKYAQVIYSEGKPQ